MTLTWPIKLLGSATETSRELTLYTWPRTKDPFTSRYTGRDVSEERCCMEQSTVNRPCSSDSRSGPSLRPVSSGFHPLLRQISCSSCFPSSPSSCQTRMIAARRGRRFWPGSESFCAPMAIRMLPPPRGNNSSPPSAWRSLAPQRTWWVFSSLILGRCVGLGSLRGSSIEVDFEAFEAEETPESFFALLGAHCGCSIPAGKSQRRQTPDFSPAVIDF